jgi:hypothetical protein
MKRILLTSIIVCAFSFTSYADAEVEKKDYKLTKDESRVLENNKKSMSTNILNDLYETHGNSGIDTFSYDYLLGEPMKLNELVDFKHPFLQRHLSQISEDEMNEIKQSILKKKSRKARHNAILNLSMKYGMESALYKRTHDFMKYLRSKEALMIQAFNYKDLMLGEGKIRPAVVDKIDYVEKIEDKRTVRKYKNRYYIAKQAEVVLTAPTYLDFFTNLSVPKPKAPQIYLLPVTKEERTVWGRGIINGWIQGMRYADDIIQHDIRELFRDFIGSNRYLMMTRAKIMTLPNYAETTVGTNSNGSSMNVGESVFEITSMPRFNDNELGWIALPEVDDIFNILTDDEVERLTAEILEVSR